MSLSVAEQVAMMSPEDQDEILAAGGDDLEHDWDFWGRPEQIWRPGPETHTIACAGRGWGKNAAGSHAANYVGLHPELCGGRPAEGPDDRRAGKGAIMAIAGRVAGEVNNQMIDGDSGIMAACDPALRPKWNKQAKTLVWPTGVTCRIISADVPDSARGPNVGWFWADEMAFWRRLAQMWRMLKLTHRKAAVGQHPRAFCTTTPRGVKTLLEVMFVMRGGQPVRAPAGTDPSRVHQGYLVNPLARIIGGSSYDNRSNLAPEFLRDTVGQLEGTPEGQEEIWARIRFGTAGAPWKHEDFHRCEVDQVPDFDKVIVSVDPTVSDDDRPMNSDDPCECGIGAMGFHRATRKVYALRDRSLVARPRVWADRVVDLAIEVGATEIVCEDNNGGELVRNEVNRALDRRRADIVRRPKVILVKAHRSKYERACLAAPMWEDGAVVHVGPPSKWVGLEGQCTQLDPNRPYKSQPTDRMDWAVWGVLQLLGDGTDQTRPWSRTKAEGWKRALEQVRGR